MLKPDNTIEDIPLNTFQEINPILVILVIDSVESVKERLDKRDNKNYDKELLRKFNERESIHAQNIADELGVECIQITSNDIDSIKPIIRRIIGEY